MWVYMFIYKIMSKNEWSAFQEAGKFAGAAIDLADGFIHFSTAEQMIETAAKHFSGRDDLCIVWGEDIALGAALKWEVSRGGAEFPHLYRDWMLEEVTGQSNLPWTGIEHDFSGAPT